MARPERFELPTFWFVARHSIQLSYGRSNRRSNDRCRFHASSAARCPDTPLGFASGPAARLHPRGVRDSPSSARRLHFAITVSHPTELRAHNLYLSKMAEREGFEPSKGVLNPYSLSRGALSTTQPPLRLTLSAVCRSVGITRRLPAPRLSRWQLAHQGSLRVVSAVVVGLGSNPRRAVQPLLP